jgi:hypothetical protein
MHAGGNPVQAAMPFSPGAAEVHQAGAMLDEHQDVQSFQQRRVNVQEVGREDPGGPGRAGTTPGRARACVVGLG